jgi:outer membrane putative beta-barrel porin/alpha-amylase
MRCFPPSHSSDGRGRAVATVTDASVGHSASAPRRRRFHRLGLTLAAWVVALPVGAPAEPPLPDELAITDSISMTEQDELYIAPSIEFFRLPDEKRLSVGAEFAYGITDRLQLDTHVPYAFVDPDTGDHAANGIGDVSVEVRYALLDYREHPFGLDLGFGLQLPTGDKSNDLGEGRVSSDLSVTASLWLGPVDAQLNAGWHRALDGGGNEPKDEGEYNVALLYPIRDWFLVLEGNGESDRAETKYYVTPELVWKPADAFELRVAAPYPVTHAAGEFGVIAGFTVEFEHLLRRSQRG